jgi:hypothetical protein
MKWRERIFRCRVCRYMIVRYARSDADDGNCVCWDCEDKRRPRP